MKTSSPRKTRTFVLCATQLLILLQNNNRKTARQVESQAGAFIKPLLTIFFKTVRLIFALIEINLFNRFDRVNDSDSVSALSDEPFEQ